jgi:hypothetical protein
MEDMSLTSRLFRTSSKLHFASDLLPKLSEGCSMVEDEMAALKWAGSFLCEMDWSSQVPKEQNVGGGLILQATSVRPTFYSCLLRIAPLLREAGLETEEQVVDFLSSLYRNLLSPGSPGRGHKKLNSTESKLGALLLHEIAETILVQLSNNGLPRVSASLKDDWEPNANVRDELLAAPPV